MDAKTIIDMAERLEADHKTLMNMINCTSPHMRSTSSEAASLLRRLAGEMERREDAPTVYTYMGMQISELPADLLREARDAVTAADTIDTLTLKVFPKEKWLSLISARETELAKDAS